MHRVTRSLLLAGVAGLGLAGCGDDVTVQEPQPPATTVTITPAAASVAQGAAIDFGVTVTPSADFVCTVTPAGLGTAAKVGSACRFTAGSTATGSGTVTATSGTASASAAVTVTGGTSGGPVLLSFVSLTTAILNLPVNLGNVAGQIEATLNLDPQGATVDSIAVFIGNTRGAVQYFTQGVRQAGAPALAGAAGNIVLSINTAAYSFNSSDAGTTNVVFQNGSVPVYARAYWSGSAGANQTTTALLPSTIPPNNIILNNEDSWAATVGNPQRSAVSGNSSSPSGLIWYGGPGTQGELTVQVWPVVYTPGRSVNEVVYGFGEDVCDLSLKSGKTKTVKIGKAASVKTAKDKKASVVALFSGGPIAMQDALPFRFTTSYDDGGDFDVFGYQTSGSAITTGEGPQICSAIDNATLPYPTTFIDNTVQPGSYPPLIRVDWLSPYTPAPDLFQAPPLESQWINGSFSFINATGSGSDDGVGLPNPLNRAFSYSGCGATNVAMATGTGADIPECATDFGGGEADTGPYTVTVNSADRLENVGDAVSDPFGVDKTAPTYDYTTTTAVNKAAYTAPLTGSEFWQGEFIDDRSGFYLGGGVDDDGITAQQHFLARADGNVNWTGTCLVTADPGVDVPGANFITDPTCVITSVGQPATLLGNGFLQGPQIPIDGGTGQAGYSSYESGVYDKAGNLTLAPIRLAVLDLIAPVAPVTLPPTSITAAAGGVFKTLFGDDVEVISSSYVLNFDITILQYPLAYPRTAQYQTFDDLISVSQNAALDPQTLNVNPFTTTGAPFVVRLEQTTAVPFPGNNIPPAGTFSSSQAKPQSFQQTVFDGFQPLPNVGNGPGVVIFPATVEDQTDFVNQSDVFQWRVYPNLAAGFNGGVGLKAQALSPTNVINPPFARVDFYRQTPVGGGPGTQYEYLGSSSTGIPSDQGVYRSWIYMAPNPITVNTPTSLPPAFGSVQGPVVSGDIILAIGVLSSGAAIAATPIAVTP